MHRLLLPLLLLLLSPLTLRAQEQPMRVLFVGNSYTSVNNLPAMVAALSVAAKEKRRLEHDRSTPGGWTLQQHLLDPKTQTPTKIAAKTWDFVVLQEQSQLPFMYPKSTIEHGTKLGELIKAQKATPLLYLTWAREHQPENQEKITGTYKELAKSLDAPIAPVGLAWEAARKRKPELKLYTGDKSHPAPAGTYLAACVFYAVIYDRSPVGLPARLVDTDQGRARTLAALSDEDAKLFQEIAWSTVQSMKPAKKAE